MGTYRLEELDGVIMAKTFACNRLKKFHPRQNLSEGVTPDFNMADETEVGADPRQLAILEGWPLAVMVHPVTHAP